MDFVELVKIFGLPGGMLAFALIAYHKDWVVSGTRFRKVEHERGLLLRLSITGTRLGTRSAGVAERALAIVDHRRAESDDDADAASA